MGLAIVGSIIVLIAVVGGWLFVRNRKTDEKQIKIVFFVFYFWLLVFVQLILSALVYHFMTASGVKPFN